MNMQLIFMALFWMVGLFLVGFYAYNKIYKKRGSVNAKLIMNVSFALIALRALYALVLSYITYNNWANNIGGFGARLLPPYTPINYFLKYTLSHFLLGALITIGLAFAFYYTLKALKKHSADLLGDGDLELGLAAALVVGWPQNLLFAILAFLLIFVFSAIRKIFFKESAIATTVSLLVSLLAILIWGGFLINFLGLNALVR